MYGEVRVCYYRIKERNLGKLDPEIQKIWISIAKNYSMIGGAQLSNSFIILLGSQCIQRTSEYSRYFQIDISIQWRTDIQT